MPPSAPNPEADHLFSTLSDLYNHVESFLDDLPTTTTGVIHDIERVRERLEKLGEEVCEYFTISFMIKLAV